MIRTHTRRGYKTFLGLSACILLGACQTAQSNNEPATLSKIDSALQRAAAVASSNGSSSQSIGYLEKIYKRNSGDVNAALNYAVALREMDYLRRAAAILEPFANDSSSPAAVKTEYAATQLALGNYAGAEKYAQKAIMLDEADYNAYHYLGVALDAQAEHKKAERAFRKGLDHWQGDPTSIMNNLALNLASQGFLEESIEILQKAQAVAPNRMEIERNLRIVTALQQSHAGYNAPKPKPRPAVPAPVVQSEPAAGDEEIKEVQETLKEKDTSGSMAATGQPMSLNE